MKLYLRDLFWLVLVAAVAIGWWADRSRQQKKFERVSEHVRYFAERNQLSICEVELGKELGILPLSKK